MIGLDPLAAQVLANENARRSGSWSSEDLTGRRFERLKVIGRSGKRSWICLCDCGRTHTARASNLKRGTTRSCGCLVRELRGRLKNGQYAPRAVARQEVA